MWKSAAVAALALAFLAQPLVPVNAGAALDPETAKLLDEGRYVYIASMRKDGSFGRPAEIWYFVREGETCVGTRPDSWRVRRIRAGRPGAMIHVARKDGPSFRATGAVVDDAKAKQALLDAFAKKYEGDWVRWAEPFRKGFEDGTRVLVCYTPE